MQKENVKRDNRILIDFWDQAFTLSEEQKAQLRNQQEDWKELAPSEKLFRAAFSLGERKKVLDYGCGSAWAAIIAAKGGCPDVTAIDAAPAAVFAAKLSAAAMAFRIRFTLRALMQTGCKASPPEPMTASFAPTCWM